MNTAPIDPAWEDAIYSQGRHLNRYPFDAVVSFVYRYRPTGRAPQEIRILEVGCGAGNTVYLAKQVYWNDCCFRGNQ
ncbi:MAG: hypothetical protein H2172_06260 [Opitutus sp.]|nr:hypothetical protein [Opitutus sp.]MCS6248370.1 hypothetical protein [Opitutus sp.]MCS6274300.1 hypothetical protein [Opitutus sp.]MCS6278609.1 hypothetical protein [Opitutus sp.]MCS6298480.1 hypothetical protein [Opitutus sp.]